MALNLPKKLAAGDSLTITDNAGDYKASESWIMHYTLSNDSNSYTMTSAADGDSHKFTILASVTALYVAGKYKWQAYVEKGAERFTLGRGWIQILSDITAGAVDTRHHVEKVLDSIEAMLEGKASVDQQSMSVAGRSISRFTPEELLIWRDKYKSELRGIKQAERIDQGLSSGNKILVRF